MQPPGDPHLPFFTYGLFQPGELGYLQLRDLVERRVRGQTIKGALRLRDGLPILDPAGQDRVQGTILYFLQGCEGEAYDRIAKLEPDKYYRWAVTPAEAGRANFLAGKSPSKGSILSDENAWTGRDDPLFTVALEVVGEILKRNRKFAWDLKPLFRLEMAYLLLWSAIERYVSLRYHLGDKAAEKVKNLAHEAAFRETLKEVVKEPRNLFRADDPGSGYVLSGAAPDKSLLYYYQVRNNIVHRGKSSPHDHERLRLSLEELLVIFRAVLNDAFRESASALRRLVKRMN